MKQEKARPAMGADLMWRHLSVLRDSMLGGFRLAAKHGFKGNFDDYLRETNPDIEVGQCEMIDGKEVRKMIKARDLPVSKQMQEAMA